MKHLTGCERIVRASAVRLRGRGYPVVPDGQFARGQDWIEASAESTSTGSIEHWRFFQSGQFVHHFACNEDYEPSYSIIFPSQAREGRALLVLGSLFTLTEIFEFTARLARRDVLVPGAELSIKLFGTRERCLVFTEPREFLGRCQIDSIEYPLKTVSTQELLARAPELALEAAEWIFERFGANFSRELLAQEQQRLLQRNL